MTLNKPEELRRLLHITIITYNRPTELAKTLTTLSKTKLKNAKISVIDNNSRQDISGICKSLQRFFPDFTYEKRRVNVGYGGNVMRAYELAESEYHWVLGDDDKIHTESIDMLINAICLESFDIIRISNVGTDDENGQTSSLSDLIHNKNSFSFYSFGFISGIVHKRIKSSKSFTEGYKFINTEYPQLFVLFSEFRLNSIVHTLENNVVTRDGISPVGAEIIGYQSMSVRALPTKSSRKIAMSYRRNKQSLLRYLLGFGLIICIEKMKGTSTKRIMSDSMFSIKNTISISHKAILATNLLVLLIPTRLLKKYLRLSSLTITE